MKQFFLTLSLLLTLPLSANELIQAGSLKVTLAAPPKAAKVTMGNFLGTFLNDAFITPELRLRSRIPSFGMSPLAPAVPGTKTSISAAA